MKKILSLILALVVTTTLWAYNFQAGDLYYTITNDTLVPYTVEVDNAMSSITIATIPETVTHNSTTYSVTSIGDFAFSYCSKLTSITIPNSVTSIGSGAFCECSSLTFITIPNSVTSIGSGAFAETPWYNNLSDGVIYVGKVLYKYKGTMPANTSITIEDGTVSISPSAFNNCSTLISVTIPRSVTIIEAGAFFNCSSLNSVNIPNSVTSIGLQAFTACPLVSIEVEDNNTIFDSRESCNAIIETATNTLIVGGQNTIIPNTVTTIGDYAFEGRNGLTSITIPNSVTNIGYKAFNACKSLTSVTIPNSVTIIGNSAFSYCSALTSVTIPNSVTSIGGYTFEKCTSLTAIDIPEGVTSIGSSAFSGCTSLTSISIPKSIMEFNWTAFSNTGIYNDESNWDNDVLYISNCLIRAKYTISGIYTVKNDTRLIADGAFLGCTSLTGIILPDKTIDRIGISVFNGCSSLTSVTIPNSVTSIGSGAFSGCSSLASITIPNSVTSIGDHAFSGCYFTKGKFINNSNCTSEDNWGATILNYDIDTDTVGWNVPAEALTVAQAREICAGLESGTQTTQRHYVMGYVKKIHSRHADGVINYGNAQFYIEDVLGAYSSDDFMAFQVYGLDSTKLTDPNAVAVGDFVVIYGKLINYNGTYETVGLGKSYIWKSTNPLLNTGDSEEDEGVTENTYQITYTTSDEKIINVDNSLFDASIVSHTYENGVGIITFATPLTKVNELAFAECKTLTSIEIPNSVTEMGGGAFYGCSALEKVKLSNNIKSLSTISWFDSSYFITIWKGFFENCTSLTSIDIPNSVTNIEEYAFRGCSSLSTVNISGSITNVGINAFEDTPWYAALSDGEILYIGTALYKWKGEMPENTKIEIREGTTSITSCAFMNYSNLVSVEMPNSVKTAGGGVFSGCTSLRNIVLSENLEILESHLVKESDISPTFNEYAGFFKNCYSLDSLTIPASIIAISDDAFSGCTFDLLINLSKCSSSNYWGAKVVKYVDYEVVDGLWIKDNVVVGCEGNLTSVSIPDGIVAIGDTAFSNSSSLLSVIIPSTVTSIGKEAFYNCTALTSITIPESVQSIGENAFLGCTFEKDNFINNSNCNSSDYWGATIVYHGIDDLIIRNDTLISCNKDIVEVTIPHGVIAIGDTAFYECHNLKSIDIPTTVTSIGNAVFYNCTSLEAVVIPNSVVEVGGSVFYGCTQLQNVVLSSNITTLSCWENGNLTYKYDHTVGYYHGSGFFEGCTSLISVEIPLGVTTIDWYTFHNCSSLKSVTIPNSVTKIGGDAFRHCAALETINIPNSVTQVCDGLFCGCTSLRSVILSENITSLKNSPNRSIGFFENCSSLVSIIIPHNITTIGDHAFKGCYFTKDNFINNSNCTSKNNWYATIVDIEENGLLITDNELVKCRYSVASAIIPEGVTAIRDSAFYACKLLESITLPSSVKTIGKYAFYNCSSLKRVDYAGDIADWCNITFEGANANPIMLSNSLYIDNHEIKDLVIPNEVDSIRDYAFYNYTLSSLDLGNRVSYIGKYAFYDCSLSSLELNKNVSYIDDFAFYNNPLQSVTLGKNIGYVRDYAFSRMDKLYYSGEIEDWCKIQFNAFWEEMLVVSNPLKFCEKFYFNDKEVTDLIIPASVDSIPSYSFSGYKGLKSLIIEDGITSIGEMAFRGCSNIEKIDVPNDLTNIGFEAFKNTLWYDNLPDGVVYIGKVLYNYKGTMPANTSINIKEGTVSICTSAFANCSGLISVVMPNSVTNVGGAVFYNCTSLKSIVLSENIKTLPIGWVYDPWPLHEHNLYGFFENCKLLTSITIPNGVTNIGNNAFLNCNSLNRVDYIGTISDWCNITFEGASANPITISNSLYIDNHEIKDLVIPDEVDSIRDYAFCNYTLSSLDLGNRVSYIGNCAFGASESFTSVVIPASIKSIGRGAFPNTITSVVWNAKDCAPTYWENNYTSECGPFDSSAKYITSFTIGDSVEHIPAYLCYNMEKLDSITMGNNVRSIGDHAFYGCEKITFITLPKSIKKIGNYAFGDCYKIVKVNYTGDIADWCNIRFEGYESTPFKYRYSSPYYQTDLYINGQKVKNIVIPNTVDSIHDRAFCYCNNISSVTLGNGVKHIGREAFYGPTTQLYLNTAIPPTIDTLAFKEKIICYVPCGSKEDYEESKWNNYVKQYYEYVAENTSGKLGTNCSWKYDNAKLFISGQGEMPEISSSCIPWELLIDSVRTIEIAQGITSICDDAFSDFTKLNTLILPNSIENIGENAFGGCRMLYDIYCYALFPPMADESSFINYNAYLYILCDYQRYYAVDMVFGNFRNMQCIGTQSTPTDSMVITPSYNDVTITWPTESNAGSYTLAINKDGEVFCTLTFNAAGQLTGIVFAPSRNGQRHAPAATQAANGFTFTVTGLEEGTDYSYNLVIKDNSGKTLQTYSGEFRTQSTNDRTVTVEYDAAQGQVTGAGTYLVGDTVTLTAIPNDGYRFVRWSNEVEDNPYTFVISDNVTLSAEFEAVIPSSLENTNSQSPMSHYQKIIRDGQLLILRDGKTYNVMGAEIQ